MNIQIKKGIKNKELTIKLLEEINVAVLKFLSPLTLEEIYKIVTEEAIRIFHAKYGSIIISRNGILNRIYSNSSVISSSPIRLHGRTYKVFKSGKAIVAYIRSKKDIYPSQYSLGVKSIILIPLVYSNLSIGVLNVFSLEEEHYTEEQLNFIQLYGSLASLAIHKARLYNQAKFDLENRNLYVSVAAHEIKTPLTVIYSYIQLLERKLNKGETAAPYILETLKRETLRTAELVNNFLVNHASTEKRLETKKACYLSEIVNMAVTDIKFLFPFHKIVIKKKVRPLKDKIYVNFNEILQALINLLSNACKFSPSNSKVDVLIDVVSRKLVTVHPSDTKL